MRCALALLLGLGLAGAEPHLAAQPPDLAALTQAAARAMRDGQPEQAVDLFRKVTELAPALPSGWYALGQAYNAIKQNAMRTFDNRAEDAAWRLLLVADGLSANGKWTDAFFLYRASLERLPSMVSIRDAIARIYEKTGHADWAAQERAAGTLSPADCAAREALCAFRAGRYEAALDTAKTRTDPESRYWQARAANELALAAFAHLETLPDSAERRSIRATVARAEDRHTDAIAELEAALKFAPGNPALLFDLASAAYQARSYERAIATLSPLLEARPDDPRLLELMGYSLLQLRRTDEAVPILKRAAARNPADPGIRLALGRAHLYASEFAAAIAMIEPELGSDQDGSLHAQLARAYAGLGQREKAETLMARAQAVQRAADERTRAAAQRTITPPK